MNCAIDSDRHLEKRKTLRLRRYTITITVSRNEFTNELLKWIAALSQRLKSQAKVSAVRNRRRSFRFHFLFRAYKNATTSSTLVCTSTNNASDRLRAQPLLGPTSSQINTHFKPSLRWYGNRNFDPVSLVRSFQRSSSIRQAIPTAVKVPPSLLWSKKKCLRLSYQIINLEGNIHHPKMSKAKSWIIKKKNSCPFGVYSRRPGSQKQRRKQMAFSQNEIKVESAHAGME